MSAQRSAVIRYRCVTDGCARFCGSAVTPFGRAPRCISCAQPMRREDECPLGIRAGRGRETIPLVGSSFPLKSH